MADGEELPSSACCFRFDDRAKIAVALFARFRVLLSPPMTTPPSLRRIETLYTGLLELLYYNTTTLLWLLAGRFFNAPSRPDRQKSEER